MERRKIALATLAALAGNSIFGFSFMFSRIALRVADPFVMLMYRFLLAFAAVEAIALYARKKKLGGWLRFAPDPKAKGGLIALGLVQPVLYFLFESYGVQLTNATVSGVIIAMMPIVALAAGALFLGEKPGLGQIGFAALSIAGVVVMTLQQSASGTVAPLGIVLLFGAVLSGVGYNVLSRRLSRSCSALECTHMMMLVAAVTFTALALLQCRGDWARLTGPLSQPSFLMAMGYLGLFSSVGAFLLLNFANSVLPVARTSSFCNLTTVLSVFAGVVFLGEPFSWLSLAAAAVIIAGVWGVQRK